MMFSDTTSYNGLIQDAERWTGLGLTQISGNTDRLKDFTSLINANYHKVVTTILDSMDEWDWDDINQTDYPIMTTNLVANQQDYTLPASLKMLKIKRAEISYDGTNWYKAEPFDISQRGLATDTTSLSNAFVAQQPFYDIQYNSIFLYPIPTSAVTAGLKVWFTREPVEFATSDTTKEPGIDEPFHRMLSIGASLDYAVAKGLSVKDDLASMYQNYEARLRSYYGSKERDRNYVLQSNFVDYQ